LSSACADTAARANASPISQQLHLFILSFLLHQQTMRQNAPADIEQDQTAPDALRRMRHESTPCSKWTWN
jgi:hypothetical protein